MTMGQIYSYATCFRLRNHPLRNNLQLRILQYHTQFLKFCLATMAILFLISKIYSGSPRTILSSDKATARKSTATEISIPEVVFLIIVCDGHGKNETGKNLTRQMSQITVLLKSATVFTRVKIRFIVMADSSDLFSRIKSIPDTWPVKYQDKISMDYLPVLYPEDHQTMINMFKPCVTARWFVPPMLPHEEAVIYVDTDFVFMRPPDDLWSEFRKFDDKQLSAMTDYININDNGKKDKDPFYGHSLNGGIVLMNLTRIRKMKVGWVEANMDAYDRYKENITMANQDILNILFHERPELMFDLPCEWNYHMLMCAQDVNRCPIADVEGASLIHGNKNAFVSGKEGHMQAVFECWLSYEMGNCLGKLYQNIKDNLVQVNVQQKLSSCTHTEHVEVILSERLRKYAE